MHNSYLVIITTKGRQFVLCHHCKREINILFACSVEIRAARAKSVPLSLFPSDSLIPCFR